MITTRPATTPVIPSSTHTNYPSRFAIGDEVIFVPASQVKHILLAQGVTCKVVGISFQDSKIMYDLALPIGIYDFYEEFPLMRVDSIFIFDKP